MYLTVSKRFELSLSLRYWRREWPLEKNRRRFGVKSSGDHGWGANMTAHPVFHGPVDRQTGMMINVSDIKTKVGTLLNARYDHKYLNRDTPPFDEVNPTPESLAPQILSETGALFYGTARPTALYLECSPGDAATAFVDGRVERHFFLEFSAARSTRSPFLSENENQALFGIAAAPSGHGHHYRLRVTFSGSPDLETGMIHDELEIATVLNNLHALLDHKNLSHDVPELKEIPMTTESLARFIFRRLAGRLPISRVSLWENPYFFSEYHNNGQSVIGIQTAFNAAHRLHSPTLSESRNDEIYGKCNNPSGHGHQYRVEASSDGPLNEISGTLHSLTAMQEAVATVLRDWDYKHLDLDTNDFTEIPTTGENIVNVLWPKIESALNRPLYRLRLWETPNNRFTLRRSIE